MGFLIDTDYDVLIRDEIKNIISDYDHDDAKILRAEDMAIAQVTNFLFGRYDTDAIFQTAIPENRNAHIVMLTIDCALYHLYTSLAPDKIPSHRADRYQDALNWLEKVATGRIKANLPLQKDDDGNERFDFRISSERKNEDNKW